MKATTKLTCDERRAAIIKAVRRVFAERGFHGTTTRALAEAAGVSEALLFKHFPNKEALFTAMQQSCYSEEDQLRKEKLMALEPSASTLVMLVHFLVAKVVGGYGICPDEQGINNRMTLRSLAEDGDFARHFLGRVLAGWSAKIDECLKAAVAAGDAIEGPIRPMLAGWFAHHLAVMTMIYLLPAKPIVDYGMSREKLVEPVVWFALRGMGLKEEAIKRLYNPKALALFLN